VTTVAGVRGPSASTHSDSSEARAISVGVIHSRSPRSSIAIASVS